MYIEYNAQFQMTQINVITNYGYAVNKILVRFFFTYVMRGKHMKMYEYARQKLELDKLVISDKITSVVFPQVYHLFKCN